jgi:cellulose synthase/poly-beta-1,6-N-acetylglucosamine synthase-like glycosyltransferase/spore germination protein YaaH/peptidoglycan/xylan/chitin deacetylase (PgdA/CDA1 family)
MPAALFILTVRKGSAYLTCVPFMANESQIFQTGSRTRWQRFKWAFRLLLFLVPVAIVAVVIAVRHMNSNEPGVPLAARAMKKVLTESVPAYRESELGKKYRGFRNAIDVRWRKRRRDSHGEDALDLSRSPLFSDSVGIRAAFYVAWDAQSFYSLERNISKLNLVIPEWFFIDPNADTLFTNIDKRALALMKAARVEIMPILSNNYKSVFRGDAVHRILANPFKKQRLINDIIRLLKEYDFAGINVDLEELQETSDEPLIEFQRELYQKLHAENFLVTQDVIPFNEDYNFKALSQYNDYLILMAYDEHNDESKPGPVCSQQWIQAALGKIDNLVPPEKIILGMAGFGYDWELRSKKKASSFSYQEALANARESDATVEFDNDTYNLHYRYYDSNDSMHEVHFTDAATNFNTLRFATEYRLAGTALWRLGSEDSRLWEFYDKPMTKEALKDFDFKHFSIVPPGSKPDYIGEGEVLDVIATPTDGYIKPEIDSAEMLISEEEYVKLPSTYVIQKYGDPRKRKLVLTFDDGPDPVYTRQILDTLAYYHVPANFFLVGIEAENNIPLVKRIFREGHEIGNHTFFHPNMAKVPKYRANLEMDLTRLLIECITGHSTIMFRAPFNADSEPDKSEELVPVALSREKNYITVGESIDPEDWQKEDIPTLNGDTILNRIIRVYEKRIHNEDVEDTTGVNGNIILLHDAGGDRSATVEATGKIIRFFQSRGYQFVTVADLLGKKPDDLMPPVPKGSGYFLLQINYFFAMIGFVLGAMMESLFILFLIAGALRLIVTGILAALQQRKEKRIVTPIMPVDPPLVSIIVPAYNEEVNAVRSLHNLLQCDYPAFEIIFVDDGSSDSTYRKVNDAFGHHPKMQVLTKPNGGKASALNYGIAHSSAEYVVCIDADTGLAPDAVRMLMQHFFRPGAEKIGAVAGTVKVGNEVNILTKWQSIEYIIGQNFDRRAFAYVNAITVVPGAIGAYSKKILQEAGGLSTDTLAEDCDLTVRILRAGYVVANEPHALAYTEAPETVKQFMKQRFRWSFGVMQVFWKHRELLFNTKQKALGLIALPDILIFKYLIPLFAPIADILMVVGLLTGNAEKIGTYYLVFVLVDALTASVAFAFAKEKPWKLVWLIPQRLVYRWLMLVVLFRSFRKAIKGELQHWGVLKRTGNMNRISNIEQGMPTTELN